MILLCGRSAFLKVVLPRTSRNAGCGKQYGQRQQDLFHDNFSQRQTLLVFDDYCSIMGHHYGTAPNAASPISSIDDSHEFAGDEWLTNLRLINKKRYQGEEMTCVQIEPPMPVLADSRVFWPKSHHKRCSISCVKASISLRITVFIQYITVHKAALCTPVYAHSPNGGLQHER